MYIDESTSHSSITQLSNFIIHIFCCFVLTVKYVLNRYYHIDDLYLLNKKKYIIIIQFVVVINELSLYLITFFINILLSNEIANVE